MEIFDCNFDNLKTNTMITDEDVIFDKATELYNLSKLIVHPNELYKHILSKINRVEYATGGETVNRGYYCTNLYETFTVGGCNRGRLLKRVTNRSRITYEYCYINDNLVMVKKYGYPNALERRWYGVEFIQKKEDMEVGVKFSVIDKELQDVSAVHINQYEAGKLLNNRSIFGYIDFNKRRNALVDFEYEENFYKYRGETLEEVYHMDYMAGIASTLDVQKITFFHDDDGCPIKFIIDDDMEFINDIPKVNHDYYRKIHMNK